MTKKEYLNTLSNEIYFLSLNEKKDLLDYYEDMINDYIEDGYSEEAAVSKLEKPSKIARNIKNETEINFKSPVKDKNILTIILLVLGFPLWGSLAVAFMLVVFSFYIIIWILPVVIGSLFVSSLFAGGISVIGGFILIFKNLNAGLIQLGIGVFSIGVAGILAVTFYYIVRFIVKITVIVSKKLGNYFKDKLGLKR